MLTRSERENLKEVLAMAADPEEAMGLDELEGFLYGLVITPDVVPPGEWLPVVFGEEGTSFETAGQADEILGHLMRACNRFSDLRLAGGLRFPFALERITPALVDRMREWASGYYRALWLRPDIWLMGEAIPEHPAAEEDALIASSAVIHALVFPEDARELFPKEGHPPDTDEDDAQLFATLVASLPLAVNTLQRHAQKMDRKRPHQPLRRPR